MAGEGGACREATVAAMRAHKEPKRQLPLSFSLTYGIIGLPVLSGWGGGDSLGRGQGRLDPLLRLLGNSWEAAEGLIQVEAILRCFFFLPLRGFSQFCQFWETRPTKHLRLVSVISPCIPASESEEWAECPGDEAHHK